MARSLDKEWKRLVVKEEKKYKKIEMNGKTSKFDELKQGVEKKIPEKLSKTLHEGFYKAFQLIFSKGISVIEKTYNEDELALDFTVNNLRVERKPDSKSLKELERGIKKGQRINTCTTMVEGIGLGVFGVGLPDIPLFLGILLKGIYEASIGYGFNYKEEKEQILILKMITASLCGDERKEEANKDVESWMTHMDVPDIITNIEEDMQKASRALSDAMLLSKFLQGFFIVGMVGGVANPFIYQKVLKYVTLKYKKRYIIEKRKSIKNVR